MFSLICMIVNLVLLVAFVLTTTTAFVAWVYRANHPKIGLPDDEPVAPNITAILAWLWQCLVAASQMALYPIGMLNRNRPLVRGQRTVLLVHGYGVNSAVWWYIKRHLHQDGYSNVITVNLPTLHAGVGTCVKILAATVDRVCAESDCAQVDLVGHSMGGLVVVSYLAGAVEEAGHKPADKVHAAVAIGAPFGGTVLAFLGLGPAPRQMRPESGFLKSFATAWKKVNRPPRGKAAGHVVVPACKTTTLVSSFDNLVVPYENAFLEGAHREEFAYLGHDAMLVSSQVYSALNSALNRSDSEEVPLAETA